MMELKVFNNTISAYGGRWETRLELPVETEILIPDYLPAVFKIVKCLIEPVVMHNELVGGALAGGWVSAVYRVLPVGRKRRPAVAYRAEILL